MPEVIDVYFKASAEAATDLRSALLIRALKAEFAKNARLNVTEGAAEDTASRLFRDLGAFPRGSGHSVLIGLQNLPHAMFGRADLICLRPLEDELADFARRCGLRDTDTPTWIPQILSNFRHVIFLDLADFNASRGYAPYARIELARNYPARLTPSQGFDSARFALICHGRTPAEGILPDMLAAVGTVDTPRSAEALAQANIHIHVGYNPHMRPGGPTPLDSALNGIYSALLSEHSDPETILGSYIKRMLEQRSYCKIAYSPRDLVEKVEPMVNRLGIMARRGFRVNPELAAKSGQNDNQLSRAARRLMEILNDD